MMSGLKGDEKSRSDYDEAKKKRDKIFQLSNAVGKAVGVSGKSIAAEIKIRAGKRMGQLLKTALPNCRGAASFKTD